MFFTTKVVQMNARTGGRAIVSAHGDVRHQQQHLSNQFWRLVHSQFPTPIRAQSQLLPRTYLY